MNDQSFNKTAEQAAAFQRIWIETASKSMQAAFGAGPNSPPPELLRQIRAGIFQALAESWDEFLRSPQFLEGMKQWMESAISFRKMTNEFMGKMRNELQAPSRDDMDTIMLNVRHMEQRLLSRMDELAANIKALKTASSPARTGVAPSANRAKTPAGSGKTSRKRAATKTV